MSEKNANVPPIIKAAAARITAPEIKILELIKLNIYFYSPPLQALAFCKAKGLEIVKSAEALCEGGPSK